MDRFGTFPHHLADEPFTVPIAIHVGGVDEVDAEINRAVKGGQRFAVIHGAPCSTDGPRAEADFGNLPTRSPQIPIAHTILLVVNAIPVLATPPRHRRGSRVSSQHNYARA